MKEKVIARIRKMLAISNDASASEGERENALRMAYATMAKHNLDIAEATEVPEDRVMEADLRVSSPWTRTIMASVAELFFCNYFFSRRRVNNKDRHYFIGTKANAETARIMAFFIADSVSKESNKLKKGAKVARSFCEGAAHSIWRRCQELRRQAESQEQGNSTGTSIVLASLYQREFELNQKFISSQGWKVDKAGTRSMSDIEANAFYAGKSYGDKVQLNRQVKEK